MRIAGLSTVGPRAFSQWGIMRRIAFGLIGLLMVSAVGAEEPPMVEVPDIDEPGFQAFVQEVRAEALAEGISKETLDAAFKDIKPIRRVVERDRNQPEKRLTFDRYLKIVLSGNRMEMGRLKAQNNQELLQAVEDKYGVPKEIMVAIWGIETRYGAITGDIPLIPAVATLAYDKRRSAFFKKQLMAALQMIDKGYADLSIMKGSWAGAMGQPQFIPTSYMVWAADWDGDGKRDIWTNKGDVFASIGNYLAKNGWARGEPWGFEVTIPATAHDAIASMMGVEKPSCRAMKDDVTRQVPLNEWGALGLTKKDGSAVSGDHLAHLVIPDGVEGRAFLVHHNYKTVLTYNCAHLYGLAVGVLSDGIKAGE